MADRSNAEQNYDLRELQLVQLEVLDELKRICWKHNLRFYLAYGSCLGALRHGGFIPWDDDIDVLMPVADYDELMRLGDEFADGFFLQNYDSDPGSGIAIARVRRDGTECIEESDLGTDCHHGVFVDIYPQYQYPDGAFRRMRMVVASILNQMGCKNAPPKNHGPIVKAAGRVILAAIRLKGRDKVIASCAHELRRHRDTRFVADLYGMNMTLTRVLKYDSSWFAEPRWVEFEGRQMPIPTGAEKFLSVRYGKGFMELPPPEKRKSYHKYARVSLGHS